MSNVVQTKVYPLGEGEAEAISDAMEPWGFTDCDINSGIAYAAITCPSGPRYTDAWADQLICKLNETELPEIEGLIAKVQAVRHSDY